MFIPNQVINREALYAVFGFLCSCTLETGDVVTPAPDWKVQCINRGVPVDRSRVPNIRKGKPIVLQRNSSRFLVYMKYSGKGRWGVEWIWIFSSKILVFFSVVFF